MQKIPLYRLIPVFSTAVLYGLCYAISSLRFDVTIYSGVILRDYLVNLLLAYALFALSKRTWVFLLLQTLLMGVLYIGNAVKLSFFGGPIVPDDVYSLRTLLLLLEGWQFYLAALPLVGIASLLVFNFTLRTWGSWLALAGLMLLGITLVYQPDNILKPLDRFVGNSVWNQRGNYLQRGAVLYSLMEGARYFADRVQPPDENSVRTALARLRREAPATAATAPFRPRNVHIILLESFWDPALLRNAHFSRDPLPGDFRELWKQTGNSHILSPVFGGYTANAEFEALCGFPVVKDAVKFERDLSNDVPCLPRILREQGYTTIASHPNVPVFWNRVNAYRRLGFDTYWSLADFRKVDMVREFMSDASLYKQVLAKIAPQLDSGAPLLDYIVTYFGHWNYPLRGARVPVVETNSKVPEVGNYASTAYYKARELMDFIRVLRKRDPDSLIVAFGDHPPFLGENFAGYAESGLMARMRSSFTPAMFGVYNATPLIVIDGTNGPQKLGTLALYELPARLLQLLHLDYHGPLTLTTPPGTTQIRPIPGLHYLVSAKGSVEVCKEPPYDQACIDSAAWLHDVLTVGNDLFVGRQYALGEK
jgi:phosphoglycerol transferase MdoB-like AlkP superfamily enzyme